MQSTPVCSTKHLTHFTERRLVSWFSRLAHVMLHTIIKPTRPWIIDDTAGYIRGAFDNNFGEWIICIYS